MSFEARNNRTGVFRKNREERATRRLAYLESRNPAHDDQDITMDAEYFSPKEAPKAPMDVHGPAIFKHIPLHRDSYEVEDLLKHRLLKAHENSKMGRDFFNPYNLSALEEVLPRHKYLCDGEGLRYVFQLAWDQARYQAYPDLINRSFDIANWGDAFLDMPLPDYD